MPSSCTQDAGRVIRPSLRTNPSSGSLRLRAVSRPMSLYRAGLRFALFLPLGVAIPPAAFPPCGCRVRRCEPRCHSALSSRGDYLTNRTRVRKRYTVGTTCLATSFCSRPGATDGQATPEPVTLIWRVVQVTRTHAIARNVLAVTFTSPGLSATRCEVRRD